MTEGRRRLALLLLAAALGLAALGQFYFFYRRSYLWDGAVFHSLAAVCFVLAWRLTRPSSPRHRPLRSGGWLRAHPFPAVLLGVGLFFSSVAALLARDRALDRPAGDVVAIWLLGIGAVGLAALWPPRLCLSAVRRHLWPEISGVVGLTAVALLLRVMALDQVPYTLGGDEAWHGLLARQVLHGELRNPFAMGYMSMPTTFYWPLSWSLWLVGDNLTGLRLPAALVGAATVPVLYLFARRLWGQRTAFLAAAFLATCDYHIHYSRLGANNVWDPLFVLLALWALDRGLTEGRRGAEEQGGRGALEAGLVTGLSFYFYTGARLLPLLLIAYLAFVRVRQEPASPRRPGISELLLLAVACWVAAGPMLGYALAHPAEWNARINQVGIFQSGWLAREPEATGKSTLYILVEQFLRAAGAFHVFPDRTVWYGADRPLLGFWAGLFALPGMVWAILHWRERRHFLLLLWFWSVVITGGMLTESPPSSQRLVIAIPAVCLLVALGLEQVVSLAGRLLAARWQRWSNPVLGLLLLLLAVGNVRFYFVQFTPQRRYGGENGETATMMGYYLRGLGGNYRAYLFGAPRLYWNFGSMAFLVPTVPGQDVVEPLRAPPDFVDRDHGAVFLFLPERAGELQWVQQAFPEGTLREFHDAAGRLRFIAYEVQPPLAQHLLAMLPICGTISNR